MAANMSEVDQYTGLTAEQHARFMNEPEVRTALRKFKEKLHQEEQAQQAKTTESRASTFFSNVFSTISNLGPSFNSDVVIERVSDPSSIPPSAPSLPPPSNSIPVKKVVVIGDKHSGKSCLFLRMTDGSYTSAPIELPVDFKIKSMELKGTKLKLQLVDTTTDNKFGGALTNNITGANIIMVCYNASDRRSLDGLQRWIQEVERLARGDAKVMLVATQCDLGKQVTEADIARLKDTLGRKGIKWPFAAHVETSAKEDPASCEKVAEIAASLMIVSPAPSSMQNSSSSSTIFGFGKHK